MEKKKAEFFFFSFQVIVYSICQSNDVHKLRVLSNLSAATYLRVEMHIYDTEILIYVKFICKTKTLWVVTLKKGVPYMQYYGEKNDLV